MLVNSQVTNMISSKVTREALIIRPIFRMESFLLFEQAEEAEESKIDNRDGFLVCTVL